MLSLERVGSGSYAEVWALDSDLVLKLPTKWTTDVDTVLREGLLLRQGYGVRLKGLCVSGSKFAGFVLERALGTLDKWATITRSNDVSPFVSWTFDVLAELAALHAQDILHGDVKSRNILVMPTFKATLCDFGLAQKVSSGRDELYTLNYRAPELLRSKTCGPTTSCDIWSLGMSLYECLFDLPTLGLTTPLDILGSLQTLVPKCAIQRQALFYYRFCNRFGTKPSLARDAARDALLLFMTQALSWDERPSASAAMALLRPIGLGPMWPLPSRPGRTRRELTVISKSYESDVIYVPKASALEACASATKSLCSLAQLNPEAYIEPAQKLFIAFGRLKDIGPLVRAVIASTFAILVTNSGLIRSDVCVRLALTTHAVFDAALQDAMVVAIQQPEWSESLFVPPRIHDMAH